MKNRFSSWLMPSPEATPAARALPRASLPGFAGCPDAADTMGEMRKPGTDENNVQMSDVLCDFCHREWTTAVPMLEGHHGSCICGKCLSVAYTEVVLNKANAVAADFSCTLCLEGPKDREAMNRPSEHGWQSPMYPEAAICRRCIKQAAGALHKDKDTAWSKPG